MAHTFYQEIHLGIPVATMIENKARVSLVFASYKQKYKKNLPKAYSPEE